MLVPYHLKGSLPLLQCYDLIVACLLFASHLAPLTFFDLPFNLQSMGSIYVTGTIVGFQHTNNEYIQVQQVVFMTYVTTLSTFA